MSSKSSVSSAAASTSGSIERPLFGREHLFAAAASLLTACLIGKPAKGHLDQPATRIVGQAFARPSQRRGYERLLHRVLGGIKVAEATQQGAQDLRRELAQQTFERLGRSLDGHL
jgi:hypothetical protein